MPNKDSKHNTDKINRREFSKIAISVGIAGIGGIWAVRKLIRAFKKSPVFITRAKGYKHNIYQKILDGLRELGITSNNICEKKILLKPNLVEPHSGIGHINTHPLLVRAAIEAFLHLGAKSVTVAEGSGHRRDVYLILEYSGFADVLSEDRVPFVDLNTAEVTTVKNLGGHSNLKELIVPRIILETDMIVSMAKMKTHHWVGATLSMKNMFGIMPGLYYGWPKNVLHNIGIARAIFDINATLKADLAIVDGIVGMEGDGPIMGTPVESNVIVIGRNLPAVDATCARIMGINPYKIGYIRAASESLGPINESSIEQRGETIKSVRHNFQLIEMIPAHKGIRL